MRKVSVLLGCLLALNLAAVAQTKDDPDQKWLEAVEKMVTKGEKKVSTPNEKRVTMLKSWGDKKGYTVKVTKTEKSYSIEVTPKEPAKAVAQK